MQSTINFIYSTIRSKRKKERFETILEPLQAILQISYLSFAPIGTKLTIHNNILQIQIPNYSQSVIRWYNNDTQEDLFYLFNIFYRFKKFYHFLNSSTASVEHKKLYDILIELAKTGIGNLIRTYSQTDKIHILHTLQMYKAMLESDEKGRSNTELYYQKRFENYEIPNLSISPESHTSHASHVSNSHQIHTSSFGGSASMGTIFSSKRDKDKDKKMKNIQQILRDDSPDRSEHSSYKEKEKEKEKEKDKNKEIKMQNLNEYNQDMDINDNDSSNKQSKEVKNIDDVFIRITDIYTQELYNIIYNTLIIMCNDDTGFDIYIDGLNKILEPTNRRIKKWIDENIVF
jgi:hypothetical protein